VGRLFARYGNAQSRRDRQGQPWSFPGTWLIAYKPQHQIKVLLGNHDVELAYDDTWKPIQDAILGAAPAGAGARLQFLNRRITDNFRVNNVLVHVEHGNIADPFNSINYGPLFEDAEKNTKRFLILREQNLSMTLSISSRSSTRLWICSNRKFPQYP